MTRKNDGAMCHMIHTIGCKNGITPFYFIFFGLAHIYDPKRALLACVYEPNEQVFSLSQPHAFTFYAKLSTKAVF